MATAEFSKFADILSAALSQHHLSGFEIAQLATWPRVNTQYLLREQFVGRRMDSFSLVPKGKKSKRTRLHGKKA